MKINIACTGRQLYQPIIEHRYPAIWKHLIRKHGLDKKESIDHLFKVLKMYQQVLLLDLQNDVYQGHQAFSEHSDWLDQYIIFL